VAEDILLGGGDSPKLTLLPPEATLMWSGIPRLVDMDNGTITIVTVPKVGGQSRCMRIWTES
jgi:hypothetical protein